MTFEGTLRPTILQASVPAPVCWFEDFYGYQKLQKRGEDGGELHPKLFDCVVIRRNKRRSNSLLLYYITHLLHGVANRALLEFFFSRFKKIDLYLYRWLKN